jgi:hypothetical protein
MDADYRLQQSHTQYYYESLIVEGASHKLEGRASRHIPDQDSTHNARLIICPTSTLSSASRFHTTYRPISLTKCPTQ